MTAANRKVVKKKTSKKKVHKKKTSKKKTPRRRFSEQHGSRGEKKKKRGKKKKKKIVTANNPPKGGKDGRPTYYGPKLIELAKHYLEHYDSLYDDPIPSIAGLACALGIPRERIHLYRNAKDKEEFRNIIDDILAEQEKALLRGGLNNMFNSSITKLVLGKHGYHEKQDLAHSGPDGQPIQSITRTVVDPKHQTKRGKKK